MEITEKRDAIIENALIQCAVCHNFVPFTHNYYNGMPVEGVGHVCAGCMLAASVFHGTSKEEAAMRVKKYMKAKCAELRNIESTYKICGTDGKPLPQ